MNVSQIFENISQLLYIRGDKSYRVQSYQRVADIIGQLTHSIEAENEISYLSEMLETGCVAVNTPAVAVAEAPFGGIKQTGYGREGGSMAIKDYLNIKYTHLGIQ